MSRLRTVLRRVKAFLLGALLVVVVLAGWLPYARPIVEHARHAGRGGNGAPAARAFVPPFLLTPSRPEADYVLDYHERLYPRAARAIVRATGHWDAYGRMLRGSAYVLFGLYVLGAALAAKRLAGVAGAWVAGMLVFGCAGRLLATQAGTPPWALGPAFLAPVVAALVAGRIKTAVLLVILLATMSPVLALPATVALALLLFARPPAERGGAGAWGRGKRLVAVGLALAATLASARLTVVDLAPYGRPLTQADAAAYPELGPSGVDPDRPRGRLDDAFVEGVEAFAPWGEPYTSAPGPLTSWLVACLILAGALAATRTPEGRRLLVALLALGGCALLMRPLRPWLDPTQRTEVFPVFLLGCVLLPAALAAPFHGRKWLRFFSVAALGGLLCAGLVGRGSPMTGLTRRRDPRGLDNALGALPPQSLIAGLPEELDDIFLFQRRRTWLGRRSQIPYHQGFADEMRRRMRLVIDATRAPDEHTLGALRDEGVTHLAIRDERWPVPAPFADWWREARAVPNPRLDYPLQIYGQGSWRVLDLTQLEAAKQLLGFAAPRRPASLAEWQLRAALLRIALRGAAELPLPGAPTARVVEQRLREGVILEDLLIGGWAHLTIPATLYLPEKRTGPVPAVLLFVGHDRAGRHAYYVRNVAWRLAQQGVAAMTIDWLGMGTRSRDDARHVELGMHLIPAGVPPMVPMLGEPWRAFDYLAQRPEIDPARIAVAGQSGGAIVAMHLAALEPRVAAAVVIDIVVTNDFIRETGWGDPDTFVPGSLRYTDHGEILGLVAPRPLLVLSGRVDPVAPSDVGAQALTTTRAIYALYGAPDRVQHVSTDETHSWSAQKTSQLLGFLEHALGVGPLTPQSGHGKDTEPHGAPPKDEPPWFASVVPRLSPPPGSLALLAGRVGPVPLPSLPPQPARGDTLLWVADRDVDGESLAFAPFAADTIAQVTPTGMGPPQFWDAYDRLHLVQNAIGLGGSLLGVGVGRLTAEARALRAGGARRIVALCKGRQAALVCVTAAALYHPFDGLIVQGFPDDFARRFFFEEQPELYYVTPGLFSSFRAADLAALVAPTPLVRADTGGVLEAWIRLRAQRATR